MLLSPKPHALNVVGKWLGNPKNNQSKKVIIDLRSIITFFD